MSFFKWLVAGLVGAAVGGAAWVLIGYFANYEIGWIAWGIGLLAGLGVRATAGQSSGVAPGLAAVTAAAAVVALSKYAVIAIAIHTEFEAQRPDFESEELAIVYTADELIDAEYVSTGKEVAWPEGVTWDDADTEAEYPAEIWAAAKQRWNALTEADRRSRRDGWRNNYAEFKTTLQSEAFADSFSPYDLLWFGLAMFTAFKVGSGAGRDE
jgi:hypothetical protein